MDVVVGDEVVSRMQEFVAVLEGDALHLRAQDLVAQTLDGRPISGHVMDIVVNYLVMSALGDLYTISMSNETPAVVDVVVLDDVVMVHIIPARRITDKRHPVLAVVPDQVTVDDDSLGVVENDDTAFSSILDPAELDRAVLRTSHPYHVPVADAQVEAFEVNVPDWAIPRTFDCDNVPCGRDHHCPVLDRGFAGPAVDPLLCGINLAFSRCVEQCQYISDEVAIPMDHLVA